MLTITAFQRDPSIPIFPLENTGLVVSYPNLSKVVDRFTSKAICQTIGVSKGE